MAIEDDPYWVARMSLSSSDLAAMRDEAERSAREVYDKATRAMAAAGDGIGHAWSEADATVDKFKSGFHGELDKLLSSASAVGAEMGGQVTRGQTFELQMEGAQAECQPSVPLWDYPPANRILHRSRRQSAALSTPPS